VINTKLAPILENIKANFWFVPSVMIFLTIGMVVLTVWIDIHAMWDAKRYFPIVYSTNVQAVRALLGTIAGSMITVTSIAFSITIVSLTMASSQFGPRLMRNFMMDRVTQVVLGVFTSTFVYCILVFCAISLNEPYQFTPGLTLIWAILMTCISVGFLIHFIHHVAKSIQADAVIDDVYRELTQNIDKFFPQYSEDKQWRPQIFSKSLGEGEYAHEIEMRAKASGYVQLIDKEALMKHLVELDRRLALYFAPGNYIRKGATFAHIYAKDSDSSLENINLDKHFILGSKRTPVQDSEYAVHQLVEIALRALSPSINDPFTAIVCVDKLGSVLCDLTTRQFPSVEQKDDEGAVRLHCKSLSFIDVGRAAFDQIRQEATDNTAVTIRLLVSLNEIALQACNHEQYSFVEQQLLMIQEQQAFRNMTTQDAKDITSYVKTIENYLLSSQESN
jgi:uncharacterized membrane protein